MAFIEQDTHDVCQRGPKKIGPTGKRIQCRMEIVRQESKQIYLKRGENKRGSLVQTTKKVGGNDADLTKPPQSRSS